MDACLIWADEGILLYRLSSPQSALTTQLDARVVVGNDVTIDLGPSRSQFGPEVAIVFRLLTSFHDVRPELFSCSKSLGVCHGCTSRQRRTSKRYKLFGAVLAHTNDLFNIGRVPVLTHQAILCHPRSVTQFLNSSNSRLRTADAIGSDGPDGARAWMA